MTQESIGPAHRERASAHADWIRALQRTAEIAPEGTRTLATLVAAHAETQGARDALVGVHTSLTYAELSERADLYARWAIATGLRHGDRVALMLDSQPDYVAIWLGLSSIGVVTALINTQLIGAGLAHCLALSGARHAIVGAAYLETVAAAGFDGIGWSHGADHPSYRPIKAALRRSADIPVPTAQRGLVGLRDPALLIYTSGTTGLPKAAYVSHFRIMMWSEWFAGIMDATIDDRLFDCLPMYHSIGGVVAVGAMLAAGGTVIVRDGFSVRRFWPDVVATRATIFQYIGDLCRYLSNAADEPTAGHGLRLCIGNGLRADIWERFATRFAIPRIIEFYAATEGSFSLFNLEGRPGAIGRIPRFMAHRSPVALVAFDQASGAPLRTSAGTCVRCGTGDVGEAIGMLARAPSSSLATRFEGYTDDADTERKILRDVFEPGDVWFRTGDLMRQDAAGFYYFVDRIGDTFRWKGENVSTCEVETAVLTCPGVLDAAVYGVAVPGADGRAGMAALVTAPGFDPATLRGHLSERLPRFAQPLFLRLRREIDITGTFKRKKQALVEDGFDPRRVTDTLYRLDPRQDAYRPFDLAALLQMAATSGSTASCTSDAGSEPLRDT